MGIATNLREIQAQQSRKGSGEYGDRVRNLVLGNDQIARMRFISELYQEGDNDSLCLVEADFHETLEKSKTGGQWRKYTFCTAGESDTEPCVLCVKGREEAPIKRQILTWVYVHYILHSQQEYVTADNEKKANWKKVVEKFTGKVLFKEDINFPYMLRRGIGQGRSWENKMLKFAATYGTIKDRDYDFSKTKTGPNWQDVTYDLTPCDPSPYPKEIKDCEVTLPSTVDIAKGKTWSYIKPKTEEEKLLEDVEIAVSSEAVDDSEEADLFSE